MRVVDKKLIQINIYRSTGLIQKSQLQSVYDMTHESSLVLWEKNQQYSSPIVLLSNIFQDSFQWFPRMMSRSFFLYELGCIISWYTIDLWVKIDISPGYILSIFHVNLGCKMHFLTSRVQVHRPKAAETREQRIFQTKFVSCC